MAAVAAKTTELADSRVRIEAEVAADEVDRELERAARSLAGEIRVPGFRKGKIPPPVVIQRLGRETVLDEAVRKALPSWYEAAVREAGIAPVGDPKVDLSELPEKGAPLSFSVEVGVRPKARLGEYRGLEVGRPDPEVPEADVEAELERLRESVASLETVERRAARGDFLVLDFAGTVDGEPFEGGEARGHLLELGSGRLIPGFEEQLEDAAAGEEREVRVTFPEDYRAEALAGREAVFEVTVREVKEKRLPELGDEFALEHGGFDTLEELRADVRERLAEVRARAIEGEFREAVVDAAVDRAELDIPPDLVHAKAHEMWEHTARRLQAQGIDPRRYLEMTGQDREALVHEAEPEAERALRREAVLAAVVEAEGLEVSDDEVLDSLRRAAAPAEPGGRPPSERQLQKAFQRARAEGRDEVLREDIAMRKAVDLLVEHARPLPAGQADARERLWTPEKEPAAQRGELWTPGS